MLPQLCQKFGFTALFLVAFLAPAASPAQSAPAAQIGEITAQQENGRVQVQIAVNGNLQPPRITRERAPDRLVLNFTGAVPKSGYTRTLIDKEPVIGARTALFGVDEQGNPVTRVVLDLAKRVPYESSAVPGKFIITVGNSVRASASAPMPTVAPVAKKEQPPPPPPTVQPITATNTLNDIAISQSNGQTSVSLKLSGSVKPRTMYLESPSRFVLDFPGVGFGAEWMKPPTLRVNSPAVTAVRSALFREQPPTIRVVFDQAEGSQSPKMSVEGNSVVVLFSDQLRTPARPRPHTPAQSPPDVKAAQREAVAADTPRRQSVETVPMPSPAPTSASIRPQATSGVAVKPAEVLYQDGLLTVNADNTMLIDVLYAIGEKTGAAMEVPMSEPMLDRVAIKVGPRKPREVIATMLEGSGFNYFIIEDSAGKLQKVVLTPKENAGSPP
jgi:hypothetical protein